MSAYNFGSQLQTYYAIRAYVTVNKHAPTITELSNLRGLHFTAIQTHLNQLEGEGYISRGKGWRNIQILDRQPVDPEIEIVDKKLTAIRQQRYDARKRRAEDMYALYTSGYTMQEIGKQYGVTRARVGHLFTEFGYVTSRKLLA